MKTHSTYRMSMVLISLFLALFCACGGFKATYRPPNAPYVKGGINFHLRGDSRLNVYQQVPHALILCAYQLKDANAFNQTLEDKEGLSKLLECRRFDNSVNYSKRLIVQPGQDLFEAMEKIEGTSVVGIVAGYYHYDRKKATRIFVLPLSGIPMFRKPSGLDIGLLLTGQEIRPLTEDTP